MTSKYTKSAKGKECTVRIPGVCNHNPETVVFAHLNGGGMGMKRSDIHGAYCCSACHDIIDFRVIYGWTPEQIKLAHHEGMVRTQEIMIKDHILIL